MENYFDKVNDKRHSSINFQPKRSFINKGRSLRSFSNNICVSEDKLKRIEHEAVTSILGAFKDTERKNNLNEELMQQIEKINTENLVSQGSKLDMKKNFNCFLKKEDDEVDCRKATFYSDIYFYGHFTLFVLSIATIFNLISYYEIDYSVFFADTALKYTDIINGTKINDTTSQWVNIEVNRTSTKIESYRTYSKFNLFLCHLLAIISEFLLIFIYSEQINLKKSLMVTNLDETFISSDNFTSYIIEAIFILITPNYFINDKYFEIQQQNDDKIKRNVKYNYILLTIAMISRTYTILRYFILSSYFFNPRSQRFCKIYSVDHTVFFGLKCILKTYPLRFMGIFFFANIFIGSYLVRIFERVLYLAPDTNLNNFINDIWYTIISMTTVGYGDYGAETNPGRIIILVVNFLGVFVISIITVLMTDTFTFKGGQLKAYNMLNQIKAKEIITDLVCKLVKKCGMLIIITRKKTANPKDIEMYNNLRIKLKQTIDKILREIKILSDNNKTESDINYIDIIIDQLNFVKTQIIEIRNTIERFSNEIEISSNNNRELITIKNTLTILS